MFASAFVATVLLAPLALAKPFITSPVSSTSWAAGTPVNIAWQDDGTAPSLATFGNASVGLYVGNQNQQTELQVIAANVNVSSTAAVTFTPTASVGESGAFYFIRLTSIADMDGQYPQEAFSAKFTLTGMTGTFNSSVSAEIAGTSTAPIGGSATPAPSSAATTSSSNPTTSSSSSSSTSSSSPSTSPSGAAGAAKNGAMTLVAGPLAGLTAAAAVLLGAMLF